MPIRSFESEQHGVLLQEVTESLLTSPGKAMENICVSTFGLPKRYEFLQSGTEYQTNRDGVVVIVKVSSLSKSVKSGEKQQSLSQSHRLVELSSQVNQNQIKDASKVVESVFLDLEPLVVRTVS
eukprot:g7044.t1